METSAEKISHLKLKQIYFFNEDISLENADSDGPISEENLIDKEITKINNLIILKENITEGHTNDPDSKGNSATKTTVSKLIAGNFLKLNDSSSAEIVLENSTNTNEEAVKPAQDDLGLTSVDLSNLVNRENESSKDRSN